MTAAVAVTPPPRLPDWAHRLTHAVGARLDLAFAWGTNDCAIWVADAVQALHGHDTLAELRLPVRRTPLQARRALRRGGGWAGFMARAGLPPVAPALAQRGDVVLVQHNTVEPALGVCLGERAAALGLCGLLTVPMRSAVAAWRT